MMYELGEVLYLFLCLRKSITFEFEEDIDLKNWAFGTRFSGMKYIRFCGNKMRLSDNNKQ